MKTRSLVTTALFGATLAVATLLAAEPATAQTGMAQPTLLRPATVHPFPTRAVWPYELMSFQERYDFWLKMREARSSGDRYDVWSGKFRELEKRAAEHGVVLRDQGPIGLHEDHRYAAYQDGQRWGAGFAPEQRPMGPGNWYAPPPANGFVPERAMAPAAPAAPGNWYGPHFGPMPHPMPPAGR